jgi:hypothetical protein
MDIYVRGEARCELGFFFRTDGNQTCLLRALNVVLCFITLPVAPEISLRFSGDIGLSIR